MLRGIFRMLPKVKRKTAIVNPLNDNEVTNVDVLTKTNLLLETLLKKVDRQDQRISELIKARKYAAVSQCNDSSSTPTRKVNRQKEVPLQVRVSLAEWISHVSQS